MGKRLVCLTYKWSEEIASVYSEWHCRNEHRAGFDGRHRHGHYSRGAAGATPQALIPTLNELFQVRGQFQSEPREKPECFPALKSPGSAQDMGLLLGAQALFAWSSSDAPRTDHEECGWQSHCKDTAPAFLCLDSPLHPSVSLLDLALPSFPHTEGTSP